MPGAVTPGRGTGYVAATPKTIDVVSGANPELFIALVPVRILGEIIIALT